MLLNDSAQVMRKNTSGPLPSSAIPSGSDPFLSKQLLEKMRQPLWYPMRVAYDKSDRVVPYTYGERFHQIWPKSELVIQEYFDHGFSQNIYRSTDIVAEFLIKQLK